MADIQQVSNEIQKIENQFHRHGLWRRPVVKPPKIEIRQNMDEETREVAEVLNRILWIRSLPACTKMFGPAKAGISFAFDHDCKSTSARVELARIQLNSLIGDLGMITQISLASLHKIER
jgi:hypothetical protein